MSEAQPPYYVGPASIHDATITAVDPSPGEIVVRLATYDSGPLVLRFQQVHEVTARDPVGMMLYALTQVPDEPPRQRFTFLNWEDDDPRCLEIVAESFSADAV